MWGAIRMIAPWWNRSSLQPAAPRRPDQEEERPNMRITRLTFGLLALTSGTLVGCSTREWGLRSSSPSKLQTVASVGEKPVPSLAGDPGSAPRAASESVDRPAATGARISGRVYDRDGQPVPNAKVRLVVDGAPAGRAKFATTDRSGAFTLRGLRPGSSYTVVAEYQGEDGMMSGRAEARAPDPDVRIGLEPRGVRPSARNASIRPARARVRPAPELDPSAEEGFQEVDGPVPPPAADREPPMEEAAALPVPTERQAAARPAARTASAPIRTGWTVRQRPSAGGARSSGAVRVPAVADSSESSSSAPDDPPQDSDDDGANPLPPALEPEEPGSRARRRRPVASPPVGSDAQSSAQRSGRRTRPALAVPVEPADLAIEPADPGVDRIPAADGEEPRPIPAEVLPSARGRSSAPEESAAGVDRSGSSPATTRSTRRARVTRPRPLPTPARSPSASDPSDSQPESDSPDEVSTGRGESRRPTWRELSLSPNQVPLDESLRRTSIEGPARDRQGVLLASAGISPAADRETPPARLRLFPGPRPAAKPAPAPAPKAGQSTCRMDPNERRIVDFQLPALDGSMVSSQDFDADLILLDFWGSWCRECGKSIAHLREVQANSDGKRLQVVGIACEKGATFEQRRVKADEAVQRHGINYPVLLSTFDGSCPVKQALGVQFYPTLILVDRDGRILHVEQGATDATLNRTDRAIAAALREAETPLDRVPPTEKGPGEQ
jgi:peroxiredoxin